MGTEMSFSSLRAWIYIYMLSVCDVINGSMYLTLLTAVYLLYKLVISEHDPVSSAVSMRTPILPETSVEGSMW